jgi:hypothetical protein
MEPHISQRGRWQQQPWQQRRPCPAERLESGGTPNARPGRGSGRLDAYRVLIAVVDAAVDVARWRDKPLRRCIKSRRSFTTLLVEEAAGMADCVAGQAVPSSGEIQGKMENLKLRLAKPFAPQHH